MIKTNFAVLMAERGLKIADVYEDTGISKTTLMALAENTGKGVQFDTVDKLCNYLGIELKDFFVYVPYIWEIYFKENHDNEFSEYIVVKLKTKSTEKDYFLEISFYHPKNYDFPLDDTSFKLWISVNLEGSDAYDEKDFFNFLGELPISIKTVFFNQLIEVIKNDVLTNGEGLTVFCDFAEVANNPKNMSDKVVLNKGDKVYLAFFSGSHRQSEKELENTKIITL